MPHAEGEGSQAGNSSTGFDSFLSIFKDVAGSTYAYNPVTKENDYYLLDLFRFLFFVSCNNDKDREQNPPKKLDEEINRDIISQQLLLHPSNAKMLKHFMRLGLGKRDQKKYDDLSPEAKEWLKKYYKDGPNAETAANEQPAETAAEALKYLMSLVETIKFEYLQPDAKDWVTEKYKAELDAEKAIAKYTPIAVALFCLGSIPDRNLSDKLVHQIKRLAGLKVHYEENDLTTNDKELLFVSLLFNAVLNPFYIAGGLLAAFGIALSIFDGWLFGASSPQNGYILPQRNKGVLSPEDGDSTFIVILKYMLSIPMRIIFRSVLLGIDLLMPFVHGIGKLIEAITYYPAQKILKWMHKNEYLDWGISGTVLKVAIAVAIGLIIPAVIIGVCAALGGFPALAAILVPTGAKLAAAGNFIAACATATPVIFAVTTLAVMVGATTVGRDILQTLKYLFLRMPVKGKNSTAYVNVHAESAICKTARAVPGLVCNAWRSFSSSSPTSAERSFHRPGSAGGSPERIGSPALSHTPSDTNDTPNAPPKLGDTPAL